VTCALQFVDSIAATPTVRLDLSDDDPWQYLEETDFPPPPLKRAIASTLLADGGVVPASAYDLRTLHIEAKLVTDSADDTATALQALYRELDRPQNIIKWHEFTTEPVFFRTFRTSADRVHRRPTGDGTGYRISVDILAEHAAYGLLETPVDGVTVSTDPAAGSNGCFVDVTGVKGDVESPAIIEWPSGGVLLARQTLMAVRRRGDPSAAPFLFQAEALTQGTDTTTQPNDANFSGAGNNFSRCTFATATMQTRLSTTAIGTSGVDLRGRYRVFMRYRKNSPTTDPINLQLRWGDTVSTTTLVHNDVYSTLSTGLIVAADLGEVSIPAGYDPVTDSSGVELPVSNAFKFELRAERTSGTSTIDFDFLVFVPADDRLAILQWQKSSDDYVLDAVNNSAHAVDGSGNVLSIAAPAISGGLPMLSPGQTNRIYMFRAVNDLQSWTLTTVSPVSVSYMPRYLTVRPAST
jgi:hypothetical protein